MEKKCSGSDDDMNKVSKQQQNQGVKGVESSNTFFCSLKRLLILTRERRQKREIKKVNGSLLKPRFMNCKNCRLICM